MKNILIAVTGASPQVLTETIYALHTQGKPMPEAVYVITTEDSKQTLEEGLFVQGYWDKLMADYHLPPITFNTDHIWVITDDNGNALVDAKGVDDQSIMADFITRKVALLTQDNEVAIHASIAGGRKTMAFYMGYAMSLYGREQDVLSHVFVDDEFEFVSDFYYPTPVDCFIQGKQGKAINAKEATVTLAEIPFVRMRRQVDERIINQMETHSFSKTVSALNSANNTQVRVSISTTEKTVEVAGVKIQLTGKLLAIYLFFLLKDNRKAVLGRYFEDDKTQTIDYLTVLDKMKADVRLYKTMGLEDEGQWRQKDHAELATLTKDFVRQSLTGLHKSLKDKLIPDLFEKIKVHSDGVKSGATYQISAEVVFICDEETLL
ncbi:MULTISPECIES: CRISPR-associated ring nuclease Csm6 [Aliivibrio]|uniref:TIGR02584 family CRISPR-associated protein n=1 Tax=Aliivibrio finisterrensis TaxID=511998 RepID=A0ABY0I529_9GAMM|nr:MULTISPECIES: CRISPR-associated ring nuclease Csm6 [Aliivibrio]MDD9180011.1 CRISPR-associated ring nuclease Csm6 [Aliivibrio sp. A6]RYU51332.1 TIGR02584 family CRISPR-associated protein [Aliivibrio finisterrensis]RYU56393.1 TIGR02584 family CRISPR-associated protein [Aliivibrio finisterrensis]RYU63897.1 TIGR02584 family CRISPR-associated protein [Aliivibrio finisterrensis]RYU81409.1 TIGR02584 family CRISPR-associated protein [Aliivibrio finisterrensis]